MYVAWCFKLLCCKRILFKQLFWINFCLVIKAISYYAFGYAFAYGEPGNGFIGHNFFFSSNVANITLNVS